MEFPPNEKLEQAVIDAALALAGDSRAHAFSLPIPNTTPRLVVALFEEGDSPLPTGPAQPHPCSAGRCHMVDHYRANAVCHQCPIEGRPA